MKTTGKIIFTIILTLISVSISAQSPKKKTITMDEVIADFEDYIETIPIYSSNMIEEEQKQVKSHIDALRNWKDKETYVSEHHLNSYVRANMDTIAFYKKNMPVFVAKYLDRFGNREIIDKDGCVDSIQAILYNKLDLREACITQLAEELNAEDTGTFSLKDFDWKSFSLKDLQKMDLRLIGAGAGLLVLLLVLILWFKKANKRDKETIRPQNRTMVPNDASSAIVVRRKTTSILRKQSLEDVIDNDAYMKIDCCDFVISSAVRRIYIKNTCIKEIYNMYAEDLRNPENPKEDGCMVLGRWVHDKDNNEYYVSLEQIVLPGDDAVFSEYELNFGGKIKLKVTERLRKLRRDTNLQYDLTCWVHSHPGLGVFFSNSDENVQMQLKHPTHPNFLTAIVVDILTPKQEMGIFTFKRDGTLNSKVDIKKLYSLDELYKWAVESDRNSFNSEDYFDTLSQAKSHYADYRSIYLSNGAIIDMGNMVAEQANGLVGMVHGYTQKRGMYSEYVVAAVSKAEVVPDNELIGCFMTVTHRSIPSIRKSIGYLLGRVNFVLVYTASDDLLTSIPVVNHDLSTDESFYGEQKLEDLKIWTRRKR